jgi:hypothetical protein
LAEKYGVNKRGAVKEWKEATQRQMDAYEYLVQLVEDVHAANNERHRKRYFGVSYYAEGKRTSELESFINGGE